MEEALGILRDVAKRERTALRHRALLEAAPDAIVVATPDGRIVVANIRVELLFGYSYGALRGGAVDRLRRPDRWSRMPRAAVPRAWTTS